MTITSDYGNSEPVRHFPCSLIVVAGIAGMLSLFFSAPANAQNNLEQWSDVPTDARSISLGEAFVATAKGPSAMFYNVAGLAAQRGLAVAFDFRTNNFSTIPYSEQNQARHITRAASLGTGSWGSAGIRGSTYTFVNNAIPRYGDSVQFLGLGFSESNLDLELGYARSLDSTLDVGIGLGFLQKTLNVESKNAVYVDLGFRYHESLLKSDLPDEFAFAASLSHIGSTMSFMTGSKPYSLNMPRSMRAGVTWRIAQPDTTPWATEFISAMVSGQFKKVLNEGDFSNDSLTTNKGYWSLGLELGVWNLIFIRYGLLYRPYDSKYSYRNNGQTNIGAGFHLPLHTMIHLSTPIWLNIDYALSLLLNQQKEYIISAGIHLEHDFFPAPERVNE